MKKSSKILRHRVPRIDNQVGEHLFDLSSVSPDPAEVLGGLKHHFDVFAQEALDQTSHPVDNRIQIEDLGLKDLLTAEGEQLQFARMACP